MQIETSSFSRIYRPRELAAIIGISTATIWRMRRRGEFPAPVRLSPGTCGWPEDVIRQWLSARAEAGRALR